MKSAFYIAILFLSFGTVAQNDSLFNEAVLLLQKEKYKEANKSLNELVKVDSTNLAAYYNLGLSYFEMADYGNAIWAFEKCLRMDPSNTDIENALTLTFLKIDPEGVLKVDQTTVPALAKIRPFVWGLLSVISSILIAYILFVLAKGNLKHLKGFAAFSGVLLLFTLLFSFYGGIVSSSFRDQSDKAVITSESLIYLKDLTPSNNSLPLGTAVCVKDTLENDFISVQTSDQNTIIIDKGTLRPL